MAELTQQQRLSRLVTGYISPTLKDFGFKRNRRKFQKEVPPYTHRVDVQSSQWNTEDRCDFTINLSIEDETGLDIAHDRVQNGNQWYQLTPKVDSEELGQQIACDVFTGYIAFLEKSNQPQNP